MNFKQSLKEYHEDIPLERWNAIQKMLWKEVCDVNRWSTNDVDKFMRFATFFDLYYKANKTFPTPKESMDAILAESMFAHVAGHTLTIHSEKKNIYSDKKMNSKNKKTAPKVDKDDIHIKAYKETLRSGGKKPYLTWINNIRTKM